KGITFDIFIETTLQEDFISNIEFVFNENGVNLSSNTLNRIKSDKELRSALSINYILEKYLDEYYLEIYKDGGIYLMITETGLVFISSLKFDVDMDIGNIDDFETDVKYYGQRVMLEAELNDVLKL